MQKRGAATLIGILILLVLTISSSLFIASKTDNELTGALIGIQVFKGNCNISIKESIANIGHDYECTNTDGFQIDADNIVFDCQNHYIKCMSGVCNATGNSAGIRLNNHTGVTIRNCYIYNFTDGIKVEGNSHHNILINNYLYNNSDGIDITNSSANNITNNYFDGNEVCGVNISEMANSVGDSDSYNIIWNNQIFASSEQVSGYEACNGVGSFNFWYLTKNCGSGSVNLRGGPCLGGNWWSNYSGIDITGDGLGDTGQIPYLGTAIGQAGLGDDYPLVDSCSQMPAVVSEDITCGSKQINSSTGEGYAITKNDVRFTCNGTILYGNATAQTNPFANDMRGIEIIGVHNVTVVGCEIYNFTYGIYIQNAQNITLINLTIRDNNNTGIFISDQSYGITVQGSYIGNRNTGLQDYGLHLRSARPGSNPVTGDFNNNISDNWIYNSSIAGIFLDSNSDYNYIANNDIHNNTFGILINGSDNTDIKSNWVHNNSDTGISVLNSLISSWGAEDDKNNVSGNNYGIYLNNSESTGAISGTLIENNYALTLYRSSPNLRYLTLQNNTEIGILVNDSDNIKIDNINLSGSAYGVYAIGTIRINLSLEGNNNIFNNSYGLYFNKVNFSTIGDDFSGATTKVHNNTNNIVLYNSKNDTINTVTIYGGAIGLNLTLVNYSTIINNNLSYFSSYNFILNRSTNNKIYNNIIDNTTGGISVYDDGNNTWNTSESTATNIIGGSTTGGNYWSDYSGKDTDNDGIGDTQTPYNATERIVNGGDLLPLTNNLAGCGSITRSITLVQNITVNGSCFTITVSNITLDFAGYYLSGNGTGIGVNISDKHGVKILNANIRNFTTAIYADPSFDLNISYNNISLTETAILLLEVNSSSVIGNKLHNNTLGINLSNSQNNTLKDNNLTDNDLGLSVTDSTGNYIYNNFFNNTVNAQDNGVTNYWNSSYNCSATNNSIIGTKCSGGNFWSDYIGRDSGSGSVSPYTTGSDGIGDTNIPYTTGITGGDSLPLATDNGSAALSCQSITTTTILSGSVTCPSGNGITIAGSDLTLDCNGYQIVGSGTGAGVYLDGKENVIIKNCNISSFYYGIEVLNSRNIQIISGNDLRLNDFYGVYLHKSNGTKIDSNNIVNDNNGVYMIGAINTTISNNTINLQKKFYGVYAFNSEYNYIFNNTLYDNYHGIYLVNSSYSTVSNNNITNSDVYSVFIHKNTIDSYFMNNKLANGQEAFRIKQSSSNNYLLNNTINGHTNYGVYSTDSDDTDFINNTIVNNSLNVYLSNSANNIFTNNSVYLGTTGIQALSSNNLQLINNTLNSTQSPSLEINDSSSVTMSSNTIYSDVDLNNADSLTMNRNNTIQSILNISDSDNINITINNLQTINIYSTTGSAFSSNIFTQLFADTFTGSIYSNTIANNNLTTFLLKTITNSEIYDNNVQNSTVAFQLYDSSNNNNISDNWLKDNGLGLNISSSTGNNIYNNYFSNTRNVFDDSGNDWDTTYSCATPNIVGGPCQGGNFYSDYYGLDNGVGDREQGDGIGDQPSSHTISAGTIDTLPLVLYVARQYHDQDAPFSTNFNAYGNISGLLEDEEVVDGSVQLISFNSSSSGKAYVQVDGQFNQSDVHAETLKIDFNANKTAVNITGVTGILPAYSVYVYHNNEFDSGVYVCELKYNLSVDEHCSPAVNLTSGGTLGTYTLTHKDDYYKISGVKNSSVTVGINKANYCGASILHDITLSQDVSCNGTGFIVKANNVTIDFNGYSLIGNGSGEGINISAYNYTVIKNANILNYTTAIHVDPAIGTNISNSNISGSYTGISFLHINESYIYSNRIFNNTYGINLSGSNGNLIYNNFLNNTINAFDNGTNSWNITRTSQTNIIGGSIFGGNFWHNYTGWDTDLDGIGDTIAYNITNNAGSANLQDQLPLTETGKIGCGNVEWNITLGKSLSTTGICFNFTNQLNLVFDCAGYNLIGNNNTGIGINLTNSNLTTIRNCTLQNFSTAIFAGVSYNNTIFRNTISNNTIGVNLSASGNNTIYNNFFNNTNDAQDTLLNTWNITKTSGSNIAGGSYLGGNFWRYYNGTDNNSDRIGNNEIPYNNSKNITGPGDFLPLTDLIPPTPAAEDSGSGDSGTSSSGGSGGGGGGGSSSSKAQAEVNCTQDWQCGEWGQCTAGTQFRTCIDLNSCEDLESSGDVDNVIEKTKPFETKSCEVEEVPSEEDYIPPTTQEPIVTEPIDDDDDLKTITLASLATLLAVGGVFVYWQLGTTSKRLRRKLKKLGKVLDVEPSELLKDGYMGVYGLYMKLSEKNKQNFYGKVTKVRERIEEQLKSEKKIESLLHDEGKGDIKEQKKRYLDIYHQYQKLPAKVQKKYYHHITHLREQLERGK